MRLNINREMRLLKRRNTPQKKAILSILAQTKDHPSAGTVYERVHNKYPSIGRATVFRVLSQAAENKEILRLPIPDSDVRFDSTVKKHFHAVCRICGSVHDIWLPEDLVVKYANIPDSFKVDEYTIEFKGVCSSCGENSVKGD